MTKSKELLAGFSKLSLDERLQRLQNLGVLSAADLKSLTSRTVLDPGLAENFIENVIGYYQMPLGVATNFVIDGKPVTVPMAVEETSIIAAASKTAKWVRDHGGVKTEIIGRDIIGQVQVARVKNFENFEKVILENAEDLIQSANTDVAHGLVNRGGGVHRLEVRQVDRGDGGKMAVVHVLADACDAMGANIMNQVCEYLRPKIEDLTGEDVTMCILSNLVDTKVTRATVVLKNLDSDLIDKIVEASLFAKQDPYRAATNNKGVLNGIDPILLATGNDWRAVEAGVHAYAARSGQYRSITEWRREGDDLVGTFEAPVILGVVGGVTRLHPTAQVALNILGVKSADELSRICAAVGLVQNLGAINALTTVGIIEGHMKLHIKNLTIGAGAKEREIPLVQRRLEEILRLTKRITSSHAVEVLKEIRAGRSGQILGASSHAATHVDSSL
ncbi:MAG: hydroxymethylglutaryl-CoA reductase, degradative [Bdellovibrionales bacterium]|nr:hydroxymethylglutaryl-CoA reductase, degradative [Bdellovibrionales bacterium]